MLKRQLTYHIPIERMGRTAQIQAMIAKEAINVNGQCHINYESLHTASEIYSIMVLTLVCDAGKCDYVHRAMQTIIATACSIYSPSTEVISVTDKSVTTRNFHIQEIL